MRSSLAVAPVQRFVRCAVDCNTLRRSICHSTCCMTNNAVAGLQHRRPGAPASIQAYLEDFIRSRSMVPNGNCRYTAQSSCVVNEHQSVAPGHDNIVSEFVLNNDLRDDRWNESSARERQSPRHDVLEILLPR